MDIARFSEILASTNLSTQQHNPKDHLHILIIPPQSWQEIYVK
jgi:hypothetical protein